MRTMASAANVVIGVLLLLTLAGVNPVYGWVIGPLALFLPLTQIILSTGLAVNDWRSPLSSDERGSDG